MSYVIQAIVADHNLLSQKVFPNAFVVSLPQGKGMIPLTDEIVQAHKIPSWPFTDEGIKPPRGAIEAVVKLCAPFSLKGWVFRVKVPIDSDLKCAPIPIECAQ